MTEQVTKVPALPDGKRPETGPMQFGDDWPGVFIRGDNALFLARQLGAVAVALSVLRERDHGLVKSTENAARLLHSCSVGNTGWPPLVDHQSAGVSSEADSEAGEPNR